MRCAIYWRQSICISAGQIARRLNWFIHDRPTRAGNVRTCLHTCVNRYDRISRRLFHFSISCAGDASSLSLSLASGAYIIWSTPEVQFRIAASWSLAAIGSALSFPNRFYTDQCQSDKLFKLSLLFLLFDDAHFDWFTRNLLRAQSIPSATYIHDRKY